MRLFVLIYEVFVVVEIINYAARFIRFRIRVEVPDLEMRLGNNECLQEIRDKEHNQTDETKKGSGNCTDNFLKIQLGTYNLL